MMVCLPALTGCTKTFVYQEDLGDMVWKGKLPEKELDDISYQVREYIEHKTHQNFASDFGSFDDRLIFWMNADMEDIEGVATMSVKAKTAPGKPYPAQISPPWIVGVKVKVLYRGFIESSNEPKSQYVYAELEYNDKHWDVKSAKELTDQSQVVDLSVKDKKPDWVHDMK